jgi:hypothetical protein
MIHQCRCGFATDDGLWFASHQSQHVLRGTDDVTGLTRDELERVRRELTASLGLARPGSPTTGITRARLDAIDRELEHRATTTN